MEEEITDEEIFKYIAKKAQKKTSRVAKKSKSESFLSGYSNDSNPFGDSNLNEQFVWEKKIARDVLQGMHIDAISAIFLKEKQKEKMAEIEKIKKSREESVIEKDRREEESAMLARERERAKNQDLEKILKQLREGRAKPIDVLFKHLNDLDAEVGELDEPYKVFEGLAVKDMEELREDIETLLDMDSATPMHIADALYRAMVQLLAEQRGLHPSIEGDVNNFLHGKTYQELEVFQAQIESQMRSGTAMVVEFWEAVLKQLPVFKARVYLKHLYRSQKPAKNENNVASEYNDPKPQVEEDIMHGGAIEEGHAILGPESEVINLDSGVHWWHDQYPLRKPKYFNRVHTGYEWNKYNRTHYDHDNPPPKMVQGYKFDIFYPDLLDNSKAPVFTIEKIEGSDETCLIRFHAGPPYEDIAFKIVDKEWEYSHKKGFKEESCGYTSTSNATVTGDRFKLSPLLCLLVSLKYKLH
ncbi:hypothetical protein MKW98_000159 [Papaver atlanticum]|uniref:Splicing factor Cactin n=1 Tax=Papaver atlanticum TaxID=357466 RepID=A0AAD4XHS8_9MAGN|nr:hypothetical protein MKW98_000159 [Papaver atlanticum]